MGILEVDYRLLRDKTAQLGGLYIRLNEEIGKIAGYTANTDIFWNGEANEAYMAAAVKDLTDIGLFLGRIGETVALLRKTLDIYVQNERKVQRLIGDYMHERKNKI